MNISQLIDLVGHFYSLKNLKEIISKHGSHPINDKKSIDSDIWNALEFIGELTYKARRYSGTYNLTQNDFFELCYRLKLTGLRKAPNLIDQMGIFFGIKTEPSLQLLLNYQTHENELYQLIYDKFSNYELPKNIYKKYKFKFDYKSSTLDGRLKEEDEFAYQILIDKTKTKSIVSIAGKLSNFIQKTSINAKKDWFSDFLNKEKGRIGKYPVHKELDNLTEIKLHHLLLNSTDIMLLLSILWTLPHAYLSEISQFSDMLDGINSIYKSRIGQSKIYTEVESQKKLHTKFGNTFTIQCSLLDNFYPYSHDIEYIKMDISSAYKNNDVKKFTIKNLPYVSGYSGMVNCGSIVFQMLEVDMLSPEGRNYAECLCAFVVGSGMHSYTEVYKSINLTLKHIYFFNK